MRRQAASQYSCECEMIVLDGLRRHSHRVRTRFTASSHPDDMSETLGRLRLLDGNHLRIMYLGCSRYEGSTGGKNRFMGKHVMQIKMSACSIGLRRLLKSGCSDQDGKIEVEYGEQA